MRVARWRRLPALGRLYCDCSCISTCATPDASHACAIVIEREARELREALKALREKREQLVAEAAAQLSARDAAAAELEAQRTVAKCEEAAFMERKVCAGML